MTVQSLLADGQVVPAPQGRVADGPLADVLRAGVLCNEATVEDNGTLTIIGDPVDTAMLGAAQAAGLDVEAIRASYPKVAEIPFSSERKMMTTVHQHDGRLLAYTKGAPEAVLAHCTSCQQDGRAWDLHDAHCRAILQVEGQLESAGMYVLALATKEIARVDAPETFEQGLTFLGMQALIDPPRPRPPLPSPRRTARASAW